MANIPKLLMWSHFSGCFIFNMISSSRPPHMRKAQISCFSNKGGRHLQMYLHFSSRYCANIGGRRWQSKQIASIFLTDRSMQLADYCLLMQSEPANYHPDYRLQTAQKFSKSQAIFRVCEKCRPYRLPFLARPSEKIRR